MKIHPTAVIDPKAELDSTVTVGPFAVIEAGVRIGADSVILSHCYLTGDTTIGARNRIGPFTTIGAPPQDIRYKNENTTVVIGDDNCIREYASIHRGTMTGRGETLIGSGNLLMAYIHIAHDCQLGDHIIMANAATFGGHVQVENKVTIGGLVAVHQFSRIGEYAYIGGMSGISKDVPPYVIVTGQRNQMRVSGINRIGLKRAGFDSVTISNLSKAFSIIFKAPDLLLQDALQKTFNEFPDCEPVHKLIQFFQESKRTVVRTSGDE